MDGMIAENGRHHALNVPMETLHELENFNDEKLKKWRVEAAERCHASLGPFPALCFSGGIDSQAMLQCFAEADLEAHVIIFTYKDDLNKHDVDHAKAFCHTFDIPYREIEFDIVSFLTRDNSAVTQEYGGISPQFNTHYRFVEILTHMGYTGVCFGGNALDRTSGKYGINTGKIEMHWLKCHDKFQIAMQGSFLSFSPELSLALTLSTPETTSNLKTINDTLHTYADGTQGWEQFKKDRHARYELKIIGYKRIGFDIMQQPTKYTGFELVQDHFAEETGDGWAFEKRFRYPLSRLDGGIYNKDMHMYKLALTKEQQTLLDSIYLKHFPSSD